MMSILLVAGAVIFLMASNQPASEKAPNAVTAQYRSDDPEGSRASLRQSFAAMDRDGSGFIELSEMRSARIVSSNGNDGSLDAQSGSFVDMLDADGDGRANFAEFEAWVANRASDKR